MPLYALDTSSGVKRYATETGSPWITALTNLGAGNQCCLAAITRVELVAALFYKVVKGQLTLTQAQQAEQLFRQELATHFRLLPVTAAVLDRAMQLAAGHFLRAYDAVQLAVALQLRDLRLARGRSVPTLVSADQLLNQAALAEGLSVDDPNQHP